MLIVSFFIVLLMARFSCPHCAFETILKESNFVLVTVALARVFHWNSQRIKWLECEILQP